MIPNRKPEDLIFQNTKYISCHNNEHFFKILISNNGSNVVYFIYFDFEIYFVSQWNGNFHFLCIQMAPYLPH